MKHAIIAALLALVCAGAHANKIPHPGAPHAAAGSRSSSSSGSKSGAVSGSESGASAQNIDYYDGGRSYALFNALRAAPMPATTCPDHRNNIVSILFGVLSFDFSTAAVDHVCLDKVLAAVYPVPAPPKLPPTGQIHPSSTVAGADGFADDCAGAPAAPAATTSATAASPGKNGKPAPSSATPNGKRVKTQQVAQVAAKPVDSCKQ